MNKEEFFKLRNLTEEGLEEAKNLVKKYNLTYDEYKITKKYFCYSDNYNSYDGEENVYIVGFFDYEQTHILHCIKVEKSEEMRIEETTKKALDIMYKIKQEYGIYSIKDRITEFHQLDPKYIPNEILLKFDEIVSAQREITKIHRKIGQTLRKL